MLEARPVTVLCLASYFKGGAFLEACKRQGSHVILLTKENLADESWPAHAIDERFLLKDLSKQPDITYAVSYLARTRKIDLIVPLDDFDVETAASLREHLRIPGMGDTTARHFRDKLAMRVQAREAGLLVPDFSPVVNYDELNQFISTVPPPWVLKPRSQAGAMGIKKVYSADELWHFLEELGDKQSFFVLEKFVPGDIFHVDAIVSERQVVFSEVHKYMQPPLRVSHEGGVFISGTVSRESRDVTELTDLNDSLMSALGMVRGITHTEFIKGEEDGRYYFLETAARVAGANIAEMIQFATGVDLWSEWASIELSKVRGQMYEQPEYQQNYAGILVCLSKQEYPDLSGYNDSEVVWKLHKKNHAGLIIASESQTRVEELLFAYSQRFANEFLAVAPPLDEAPI